MASPFHIFRKYQKSLMVGAGVICMFVFVIGDSLRGFLGSRSEAGRASRDMRAVAVSWDGGSLTNADVENLVQRRRITNGFLNRIDEMGQRSAILAGLEPRRLNLIELRGPENQQQRVEQSVVQSKLFADAAREAGMSVSNDAITQYLYELGRGRVTVDDMRSIIQAMQSGGMNITSDFIMDALREEMLANMYIASHMYAFQTVTPEQRWEDWLRANDDVVVEAAAIPVESFVVDVPDPKEAELVAFYEKYKGAEPGPDVIDNQVEVPSARPGFRVPRKIDVQFIEANFEKFMAKAEEQVTDEEIAKFYEANKDMFVKAADTGLLDEAEDPNSTGAEGTNEESKTESPPPAPGAEATPPATEPAGETTPPAAPTSPPATPEGPTPPATTDPAPQGETPATTDENKQSSNSRDGQSVFRLVAFLQENSETSTSSEPSSTTEAAATTESTPPASAESPAAAPSTAPAESPPTESPASLPAATEPPATTPSGEPSTEKPKEYQPLDEVKDVIRRKLATDRVREQFTKSMDEIMGQLDGEYNKYLTTRLGAEDEKQKPPAPPAELTNFAALAEKHGFTAGKTGPMGGLDFRNLPIGKSGTTESRLTLTGLLFTTQEVDLYEPMQTVDMDGNRYIVMKTSDEKASEPALKDVKEQVVRAYKLQKAAELALKDAEAQAKKAQESRSSLSDFFADKPTVQVVKTDPFAQRTRGDVPDQYGMQPYRISQPDGIVAAGPELMEEVFALKDGEVGAVLNHDESIAYVVRIVEHVKSPDELRNAYLAEANIWDGLPITIGTRVRQARAQLDNDVLASAHIDWQRDPDPRPQEREVD